MCLFPGKTRSVFLCHSCFRVLSVVLFRHIASSALTLAMLGLVHLCVQGQIRSDATFRALECWGKYVSDL